VKRLECSCCGDVTRGEQWWNRDTGYGLCDRCADWIPARMAKRGETPEAIAEEMRFLYGERGRHYCVEEKQSA
jgi:hypothetical protein